MTIATTIIIVVVFYIISVFIFFSYAMASLYHVVVNLQVDERILIIRETRSERKEFLNFSQVCDHIYTFTKTSAF